MPEEMNPESASAVAPAAGAVTAPRRTSSNDVFVVEAVVDHPNVTKGCRRAAVQPADIGRIVEAAVRAFAQRLGKTVIDDNGTHRREATPELRKPAVVCRRIVYFKSRAVNVHADDEALLGREEASLVSLASLRNVEVITVPIDFRGHHYRTGRRLASPNRSERTFQPVEKGVDVALASHLVQRCLAPDRPDGVLLMSGDADFLPVIRQVAGLQPPVVTMVAGFRKSLARAYFDPGLTGFPPIVLDDLISDEASGRTRLHNRDKGGRKMSAARGFGEGRDGAQAGRGAGRNPWGGQDIGRIAVNSPQRARLDVYQKKAGGLGATVVCDADGGRYGVSQTVLSRFQKPGTFRGWAFVDRRRAEAFFFTEGEASAPPPPRVSIEARGEFVIVKGSPEALAALRDGAYVGFRAYLPPPKGQGKARRVTNAADVNLLDGSKPLVIAGLLSAGRLVFPDHSGIAELLLDAVTRDGRAFAGQDARLVEAALSRLVEEPGAPGHLRTVARIELSKRRPPGGNFGPSAPGAGWPTVPRPSPVLPAGEAAAEVDAPGAVPGAGDVDALNLRLD